MKERKLFAAARRNARKSTKFMKNPAQTIDGCSGVILPEGAKVPNAPPTRGGITFRYCLDREDF